MAWSLVGDDPQRDEGSQLVGQDWYAVEGRKLDAALDGCATVEPALLEQLRALVAQARGATSIGRVRALVREAGRVLHRGCPVDDPTSPAWDLLVAWEAAAGPVTLG